MRRINFWGLLLILIGTLLLLSQFLPFDIGQLIWPLILISIGVWILWGALAQPEPSASESLTIPLEGAAQARIRLRHGAGEFRLDAGSDPETLISGSFAGGVDSQTERQGETVKARLGVPSHPFLWMPWSGWRHGGFRWDVKVNPEVELALDLKGGASESQLDLSELNVTELRLETGASSTKLVTPAKAEFTKATVKSGAASVIVHIPEGVRASIHTSGGLSEIDVDQSRFPRVRSGHYRSPDYEDGAHKIDLSAETGVGSIKIR